MLGGAGLTEPERRLVFAMTRCVILYASCVVVEMGIAFAVVCVVVTERCLSVEMIEDGEPSDF